MIVTAPLRLLRGDPTHPRIDLIVTAPGRLEAIAGTPTVGATLENLRGAPCLPAGASLVMRVLVPANAIDVETNVWLAPCS